MRGAPRGYEVFEERGVGLAPHPPPPHGMIRAALISLMLKLRKEKAICLKLLSRLDKALQSKLQRDFQSTTPCKGGCSPSGANRCVQLLVPSRGEN